MHKLEVIIDETGFTDPSTVTAKEVTWNDPDWDLVSPTNNIAMTKGTQFSGDLYWYYANIEDSGNYSIFKKIGVAAEVLIIGYEGKYIDTGDLAVAVASNTAHATLVAGNPHAVTAAEVSLGNVENLAAVAMVTEGLSVASIQAISLTINDLEDGLLEMDSVDDPGAVTAVGRYAIWMDLTSGDLKCRLNKSGSTEVIKTIASYA